MRTAAKGKAYCNCPAWLAPLGNRKTRNWARCTLLLQPVKTLFHCQREVGKSQKSLTTMLFDIFLQTTTMGKVYNNYPAQLAPLSSEKTQPQVRRNELQTLQTLAHHWEVCKSRKSLTAMLVRMVLQPAAEKNVCCDCLVWLASVGSWETCGWVHPNTLQTCRNLTLWQQVVYRLWRRSSTLQFGLLPGPMTTSNIYPIQPT